LLEHHRNDIAELHAPDGQCNIAIKGGLEFIVHKAQAQCHLFIDNRHAFETLTTHAAPNNPWKHIDSTAHIINTQITQNETDTPHADTSKAQTQRRFRQTMTTAELLTQMPLIPKDTSSFLPSSPSPLTSIALHNLPRSEPSNRLNNESFTLLTQRKLRPHIIHQPGTCTCGTTFDCTMPSQRH
jgi:septal ring-binding cell division protein DamX